MTSEEANEISKTFEAQIQEIYNPSVLAKTDLTKLEPIKIESGKSYIVEDEIIVAEENNSCYIHVYQISQGFEHFAESNWLGSWLKDEYFEELRTNQQLGYAVFALTRNWNSVRHFAFCIQSDKESSEHCRKQTIKFLEEWKVKLAEMSEEDFDKTRQGCIARVTEKHKNLNSKFGGDLTEVMNHEYKWNKKQLQAEALEALTKEQIVAFYDHLFFTNARTLEFHQYAPSRQEEGVNFRKERVANDGLIYAETSGALKSQLENYEDVWSLIP
jgi:insulysin